jgi:hypothetical protein
MTAHAVFDSTRTYRYVLTREWGEIISGTMIVVGLNPSTADENVNDPTIRRCIGFAQRDGYGRLVMLNLFALRATNPLIMLMHPSPIGEHNNATIIARVTLTARVVVAWGTNAPHARANDVLAILRRMNIPVWCWGETKDGSPKHPLYLRADTPLVPYIGDGQ